jgi:hypothetical protein
MIRYQQKKQLDKGTPSTSAVPLNPRNKIHFVQYQKEQKDQEELVDNSE